MLVEFSVGNFLSFKEKVTLSLEASSDEWLEETHVATVNKCRLLKSAAIYGANASGKSNFLNAMAVFRKFVQESSKESQAGERTPASPFRLSTVTETAPSHFEAVLFQNGTRYRYGFEATAEAVCAEWLFSKKDSIRETRLFTREHSQFKISPDFKEGKGLDPRTRPNALFLSVASQFNGEIASEIMMWVERFRGVSGARDDEYMRFTAPMLDDEHLGARIRELTRRADVGIKDLQKLEIPPGERAKYLPKAASEEWRKAMLDPSNRAYVIKAGHRKFDQQGKECGTVEFELEIDESAGTRKLVSLSGPFLQTLDEGFILFIDELEARLHPLLTKSLVGLFNGVGNAKNAQLIYATHDEGLLDPARIRRDQVWFVEKDEFGVSRLYSLAEFKVRKEAKFGKEYLLGQFGAVPHIRDLERSLTHAT